MYQVVIAFGGNLGDVLGAFRTARAQLAAHSGRLVRSSSLYRTAPLRPEAPARAGLTGDPDGLPPADVPDYLNAACLLETALAPETLLRELQRLEWAAGRRRTTRWASRELDLDLLVYGQLVCATSTLVIPHPHLRERPFVLFPLADVAPNFALPPDGMTPARLLALHSVPKDSIEMQAAVW